MKSEGIVTKANFNLALAVLISVFVLAEANAAPWPGGGTQGAPYLIADVAGLQAVGADPAFWDAEFELVSDIDLAGLTGTDFNIIGYYDDENNNDPFVGVFDGGGHVIGNFAYISDAAGFVGLFAYVGDGGKVRNLGLADVDIDCQNSGAVAGLVAYNDQGSISQCYVTGSVSAAHTVGGLVGLNAGDISDCHVTGSVAGATDLEVGGLVGNHTGGVVSGCYAAALVTADLLAGGFAGVVTGGEISNSFWDTQVSRRSNMCVNVGPGCDNENGKSTAEMKTQSIFTAAGWDFVDADDNADQNIWRMCVDDADYPLLWWQFVEGDFGCPDGVNTFDLGTFADHWLDENCDENNNHCARTDIDTDTVVNGDDFALFAKEWLAGI